MFLPPQLPDATVPPRATIVATTTGVGVQIYTCQQLPGAQPAWQWVFDSPEATLTDTSTHQQVATHSKGPTWVWRDGSTVTGEVITKLPAEPGTIPVLLLKATHPANSPTGILTPVAFIRRSAPQGGAPTTSTCNATQSAAVIRVPYTATYTFYTAKP